MRKGILAAALSLLGGGTVAWGQEPVSMQAPASASPKIWGSAEYLLWFAKTQNLSTPVVTTSSKPALFNSGGVGVDGTSILLGPGGQDLNYPVLSGGRLTIGTFLDSESTFGVEGRGFLLQKGSVTKSFASNAAGSPFIGLPIIDTIGAVNGFYAGIPTGAENSLIVATPGFNTGSVSVVTKTQLWGFEVNGVMNFLRNEGMTVDLLAGFRYADLQESLGIFSTTAGIGANPLAFNQAFFASPPAVTTTADTFLTRNQFYGGQIGGRADMEFGRFFVDITGKIALGSTHEQSTIGGASALTGVAAPAVASGGIYAQKTNIGTTSTNSFSVIPEVEAKVGYKITDNLRGFVGYNFMFWSQVMRPGEQIDRNVNTNLVPTGPVGLLPGTAAGPSVLNTRSGYWAQGLNFGLEFRY